MTTRPAGQAVRQPDKVFLAGTGSRAVRAGLNINQSLLRKRKEVNGKAIRKF